MAVYDLRDKNSGVNPWNYLLAKGAGGLLDNFIDGMFKRDAEAREIRRNKGLYEDMVQAGSPQYETVEAPGTNVYFPQEENDYGAWNGALDAAGVGAQPMGGLWDTMRQTTRQVPGTGMTRENMMKVFAKRGASSDQVKSLI
ncbi:MAG: hypothetical protein Q4C86_14630 [bacterium]|nr:hypothetical protein [bacterium]